MDLEEEIVKLRTELAAQYREKELEADNALIAIAKMKYSGLAFLGFAIAMFTSGFFTSKLLYGIFFCV